MTKIRGGPSPRFSLGTTLQGNFSNPWRQSPISVGLVSWTAREASLIRGIPIPGAISHLKTEAVHRTLREASHSGASPFRGQSPAGGIQPDTSLNAQPKKGECIDRAKTMQNNNKPKSKFTFFTKKKTKCGLQTTRRGGNRQAENRPNQFLLKRHLSNI